MSELYRSAFKLLSIRTRDVRVTYPMRAQIITTSERSQCWYWNRKAAKVLLETSRYVYGHQNTAHRTGICLKRQDCTSPVSSFVVRQLPSFSMLHCPGIRSNGHCADSIAANVVAPYERILMGAANLPISWLMVHDVVLRFCMADLTLSLSSRMFVIGGFKILHVVRYDPQQPIYSIFAWQWLDFDQCNRRNYGTIIHNLDR